MSEFVSANCRIFLTNFAIFIFKNFEGVKDEVWAKLLLYYESVSRGWQMSFNAYIPQYVTANYAALCLGAIVVNLNLRLTCTYRLIFHTRTT